MKIFRLPIFLIIGLAFLLFLPGMVFAWNSGNYTYVSTELGTQVNHVYRHDYNIAGKKNNFNTEDLIFALTKIKNISGVDNFRFKYDLYALDNNRLRQTEYSNVFYPNGERWPEIISSWNAFDNLPDNRYELKVYIKINNNGYKYLDSLRFNVGHYNYSNCADCDYYDYYDDYNWHYNNNNNNYYTYNYNWSKTDTNIKYLGHYKYNLVHVKKIFYTDENIIALTKISNIKGINTFRIKQELLKDRGSIYRTKESSLRTPGYNYWEYNYTQANFGKLPAGNYKIKVYISINGGGYRYLGMTNITVKERYGRPYYPISYSPYYYNPCYSTIPSYYYNWTKTGTDNQPYLYPRYYN